jgi:hypothetical protein
MPEPVCPFGLGAGVPLTEQINPPLGTCIQSIPLHAFVVPVEETVQPVGKVLVAVVTLKLSLRITCPVEAKPANNKKASKSFFLISISLGVKIL